MTRNRIALLVGTLLIPATLVAQQATTLVQTAQEPAPTIAVPGTSVQTTWLTTRKGHSSELHKAIQAIKKSESDSEKDDAIEELRGVLEDQYDDSLENYESWLEDMEEKIREMRSQIERRKDAKGEMVELRLKMLVSEADGLGWPDERPARYFSFPGQAANPFAPVPGPTAVTAPPAVYRLNSQGQSQSGPARRSGGR